MHHIQTVHFGERSANLLCQCVCIHLPVLGRLVVQQSLLDRDARDVFHKDGGGGHVNVVYSGRVHACLFALVQTACLLHNTSGCQEMVEIRVAIRLFESLLGNAAIWHSQESGQVEYALDSLVESRGLRAIAPRDTYCFSALLDQHGVFWNHGCG